MIPREKKGEVIARMRERFEAGGALVFAENAGLSAAEMAALRDKAREAGCSAQVVKNTLAKRACDGTHFSAAAENFSGPLIYGVGGDSAQLAKIFADTAKGNDKLIIRGGALPGEALDAEGVKMLASLPPREQLLAMVASACAAPMTYLARAIGEVPSSLARALAEASRKKESSGEEKTGEQK